jgi:hypothetical protein
MLATLTKAQREHMRKQAAIDAALNHVIGTAVAMEIPVSVVADELGWTRQRVYRHRGPVES